MRALLAGLVLAGSLGLGGCSILKLWNPIHNGMEYDKGVALEADGVTAYITGFAFLNAAGPFVSVDIANRAKRDVTIRTGAFRLASGDTTFAPMDAGRMVTLAPGESETVSVKFDVVSQTRGNAAVDGPKGQTLTLTLDGIREGERLIAFPAVEYVYPSGSFHGARPVGYVEE